MHTLPEWEDTHGSAMPIALRDVLRGGGMDDDDVETIEEALLSEEALASLID